MPELPEVETIKNDLAPQIVGKTIEAVTFPPDPRCRILRRCISQQEFIREIVRTKILNVRRRAKYLICDLDSERTLVMHLGMSGQILLCPSRSPLERYVRAIFHLSGNKEIRFADPRKFGEIFLQSTSVPDLPLDLDRLGPEPLDRTFTAKALMQTLRSSRRAVKAVLMDQRAIAGLGNIYSDESLFLAGVHPARKGYSLTEDETRSIHRAIRTVLRSAIKHRGTTAKDKRYRDGKGQSGNFQNRLNVYQRRSLPCPRCGAVIEIMPIGGRTASFCPRCQK